MRFLGILVAVGFLSGCGFLPNDPEMSCKGSRMQCSDANAAERFCQATGIQKGTDAFALCMVQHQRTSAVKPTGGPTAQQQSQMLINQGQRLMEMSQPKPVR